MWSRRSVPLTMRVSRYYIKDISLFPSLLAQRHLLFLSPFHAKVFHVYVPHMCILFLIFMIEHTWLELKMLEAIFKTRGINVRFLNVCVGGYLFKIDL